MPKKAASSRSPRPAKARASAARSKAPAGAATAAKTSADAVTRWLASCRHALRGELDTLRALVAAAEPRLVEGVKWNALSYAFAGDDRLTFNLSAKDRVRLIFHCGVQKRATTGRLPVDDRGLLEWAADDRGIATFRSAAEVAAAKKALTQLVRDWLAATSG
jgi:hypothetical protein